MSQSRTVRAAVFSAGSWGTAIGRILGDTGADVVMHARRDAIAEGINERHHNPGYFPDITLPVPVTTTTNPATALAGADYLVLSIPSQSLRSNLALWSPLIPDDTVIVSLMKGIEMRGSNHPNHPALARKLQDYLRWRDTNARHSDILAAQRRERAKVRSEGQQRWGRPRPQAS